MKIKTNEKFLFVLPVYSTAEHIKLFEKELTQLRKTKSKNMANRILYTNQQFKVYKLNDTSVIEVQKKQTTIQKILSRLRRK